jgi:phospholipid-binding lipoprotein MlaA
MLIRSTLIAGLACAAIAAAAPAAAQVSAVAAPNPDPWEGFNREMFGLNKGLDRALIRPTATFYHHAVPTPARAGVHNVLYNLGEPVTFLNNVLQARPRKASHTAVRFVVNSTVGILGLIDVTGDAGMQREPSGFADTLGRYGFGHGAYIFIPVFGPSSVRDLAGRIVDVVTDPMTLVKYDGRAAVQAGRTIGGGLDRRVASDEALKDVDRTATDPYATIRSAFLQSSDARVRDSDANVKALPDFGAEPGAAPKDAVVPPVQPPHQP